MANYLSNTVSSNLKTAMSGASMSTELPDGGAFYDGATVRTRITQPINSHFRANNNELFVHNGENVRAWEKEELEAWLNVWASGWSAEYETYQVLNRRCILTIGEDVFYGVQLLGALSQSAADLEALGKAMIEYVESL